MLSDEERKEYIEHEILDRLYCLEENDFDKNKVDDGYIKAVLNACKEAKNLIKKQSKEIEELKKYEEGYKLLSYSLNNYISKDKIKAKIEESELLIDNSQGCMSNEDLYKEFGKIEFGKSLLEKE